MKVKKEGKTKNMFIDTDLSLLTREPKRWLFVTNHLNLLYMLAAGLIMPPKGFGKKYYQDTLATYPGWIPLFAETVCKTAIEQSVSERNHLIPCIANVDLASLRGKVIAVALDGFAREVDFPNGLDGTENVLFVPAPLPINWVTSIFFQSKDDKSVCETAARDFGNVPLLDFMVDVNAPIFSEVEGSSWPPNNLSLPEMDTVIDLPFAAGGIMAMLLYFGNLGKIGVHACRLSFDAETIVEESIADPLISSLGMWMRTGRQIDTRDVSSKLFWGVVMKVASCRFSEVQSNSLEVVLDYLGSAGEGMDGRMKDALVKLVSDLRTIATFSDSTITEIFERHPKSFSRVMTLFFLREKCADLLTFKHPLLTESDYIAASILFAARDGWLGLPLQLRNFSGSHAAITHRMASMSHRIASTNLDLGPPPIRPFPLRELFLAGSKGWSARQKDAALLLARECKWDCIQTRINLGKGEYQLVVEGGGVHIIISGEAKAVLTEVDCDQFLAILSNTTILDKQDRNVRDLLKE